MAAIGDWARQLHRDGLAARLVFDPYQPEVGRYGDGPAMDAAEAVFVADSASAESGDPAPICSRIASTTRLGRSSFR